MVCEGGALLFLDPLAFQPLSKMATASWWPCRAEICGARRHLERSRTCQRKMEPAWRFQELDSDNVEAPPSYIDLFTHSSVLVDLPHCRKL